MKVETQGGTTALVQVADLGGGDAAFEGVLATSPAGCLGLAPPDGSGTVRVVVWPADVSLSGEGELTTSSGEKLAVGDTVFGGGEDLEDLHEHRGDAVTACVEEGERGFVLGEVEKITE
ncbi:hypothetical protein [Isoptericola halotolerans]|uniref:Uncharacterized protein n=1 Tax=Isoptericola halotolerans TaxID=300560 RepID=A0ABX2A6V7_9MICO|nr:hypothetical protein [Isoptericola halotolerans]NOV98558.1 hypothetical protein [Isoptericola halotolerans]